MFKQGFTCPALLIGAPSKILLKYGAITLYDWPFHAIPLGITDFRRTGLLPFRSPLLRESRLISFPPGT
jgi:hypothetical protein